MSTIDASATIPAIKAAAYSALAARDIKRRDVLVKVRRISQAAQVLLVARTSLGVSLLPTLKEVANELRVIHEDRTGRHLFAAPSVDSGALRLYLEPLEPALVHGVSRIVDGVPSVYVGQVNGCAVWLHQSDEPGFVYVRAIHPDDTVRAALSRPSAIELHRPILDICFTI